MLLPILIFATFYLGTAFIIDTINPTLDGLYKTNRKLEIFWSSLSFFYNIPIVLLYDKYFHVDYNLTWIELIVNIFWYLFVMDTWFYFTHLLFHKNNFFYKNFHYLHHGFRNPTAYALNAVHPVEGIIHGSLNYIVASSLIYLPVYIKQIIGILTIIYGIYGHHGGKGDINNHIQHHYKVIQNLSFYCPIWDYVFSTRA